MNTHLHDGTASDYGAPEEFERNTPAIVWASLIATALVWCAWKAVFG